MPSTDSPATGLAAILEAPGSHGPGAARPAEREDAGATGRYSRSPALGPRTRAGALRAGGGLLERARGSGARDLPSKVCFSSPLTLQPDRDPHCTLGSLGKERQLTDGPLCVPQGLAQTPALLWSGLLGA